MVSNCKDMFINVYINEKRVILLPITKSLCDMQHKRSKQAIYKQINILLLNTT